MRESKSQTLVEMIVISELEPYYLIKITNAGKPNKAIRSALITQGPFLY